MRSYHTIVQYRATVRVRAVPHCNTVSHWADSTRVVHVCRRARCKVRTLPRDLDLIANLVYTVVVGNYATQAFVRFQ